MLDDRFRSELQRGRWPDATAFDPRNDLHLDELAGRLLERFWRDRDAEAFALLIRVTRSRLMAIARRLGARMPRAAPPGVLVDGVLRRLFNEPAAVGVPAGSFLVVARGLLEQQARRTASR